MGQIGRLLLLAVAALFLVLPAQAEARGLFDDACVLATDKPLSLANVRTSTAWNCAPQPVDAQGTHSWVWIDGETLRTGEVHLESSSTVYQGLLIGIVDAQGAVSQRYVSSRELAQNWTSGSRFSLPVNLGDERPHALFVRIDQPISAQVATGLVLADPHEAHAHRAVSMALLGICVGILAVVALISGLIARAIKRRFALYHMAFSLMLILYTISSTSMIFMFVPELSLWHRSVLSYASLAWAMMLLTPFAFDFFEQGTIPRPVALFMRVAMVLIFFAAFLLPLGAATGTNLRHLYNLAYVPGLLVVPLAVGIAWRRGSRSARAFALAWALPFACAIERVLRGLDFYTLPTWSDFLFYGAMAIEAVGITVAIALRIEEIRRERDLAVSQTQQLDAAARQDALTGLANRRDFDGRRWRQSDLLAIVDLDRFKHINDRYGHVIGDRVLQIVGKILLEAEAQGEILRAWRMGGEEFAVAMEAKSIEHAAVQLNTIRARITAAVTNEVPQIAEPVSASAGMSKVGKEIRQAYRAADSALYHAKGGGRDRLCYEVSGGALATVFPRPIAA